jgi:hypothetical protein
MAKTTTEAQKRRKKRQQKKRAEKRDNAPYAHVRYGVKTPPGFATFSDEEAFFWVAHGANYLASNYHTGLWDPVYPDLYEGAEPDPGLLTSAILDKYQEGNPLARPVIAWTIVEKVVQYTYLREVWRTMKEADPECRPRSESRKPRHPVVWKVFQEIKRLLLKHV